MSGEGAGGRSSSPVGVVFGVAFVVANADAVAVGMIVAVVVLFVVVCVLCCAVSSCLEMLREEPSCGRHFRSNTVLLLRIARTLQRYRAIQKSGSGSAPTLQIHRFVTLVR
uniref:Uncharacterized protein n=1 Tax=Pseudo-nitzschia australis TaxID=44445 RepID=A0A7S4EQG7_9STRA